MGTFRGAGHSIIAFGGGVLLAAVSLVLVPEGITELPIPAVVIAFLAGGLSFFWLDRLIARRAGNASQFLAMLLDFVPEALAMGAALASGNQTGLLLALLIALQNLPEGFNAFRELSASGKWPDRQILAVFWALSLIGPVCAWIGIAYLAESPAVLGAGMVFAAAGIIYLTFEDIAPQATLEHEWAPALGAVAGFLVGLTGHMLLA